MNVIVTIVPFHLIFIETTFKNIDEIVHLF